jgi:hypothetical protein
LNEMLQHAIECVAARDWAGADEALKALQARENDGLRSAAHVRHEIANAVSIVQANVEGMLDGVLEPSRERLEGLRHALSGITTMLDLLRQSRQ